MPVTKNGVTLTELLGLWLAEVVCIVVGVGIINDGRFTFIGIVIFLLGWLIGFSWIQERRENASH